MRGLAVSGDGRLTVGVGFDPSNQLEAFLAVIPACDNELDDDGDGFVDAEGGGVGAPDPQCLDAPARVGEAPQPAGGGLCPELSLALLALPALRRALERAPAVPPVA